MNIFYKIKGIIKVLLIRPVNRFMCDRTGYGIIKNYPARGSIQLVKKIYGREGITCAEVGTWRGENALDILKNLNVSKIYLIDPWKDYPEVNESDLVGTSRDMDTTRKKLKKYNNKIVYIRKLSQDAINDIPNGMDFIYIDGNHSHEYAKKDMELYYKKLRTGGVLAGHDIVLKGGVMKAFCEFVAENKLNPIITPTDWIVIKGNKTSNDKPEGA